MKTKFLLKAAVVALGVMMCGSAWADTTAGTITKEMNYRLDAATPTAFTTLRESNSTNTQVEISYDSGFFSCMTLSIPEINNATEVTLKVTRVTDQTNKGDLNVWAFPYDLITKSDFSDSKSTFCDNVKTVLGNYPYKNQAPTKKALGTVTTDDTSGYTQTATFTGDDLTTLKKAGTITNGTLTVNILLCTKSSTQNFKWNAISATADAPVLTVTYTKKSLAAQTTSADISFRSTDQKKNYWTCGTLHMNNAKSTFSSVVSFDMTAANRFKALGYKITDVQLTFTDFSAKNNISIDMRPWTTAYKETSDYTYEKVTKAVIEAAQDEDVITTFNTKNPCGYALFELGKKSTCPKVSQIADYQTTVSADKLTKAFNDCTGNTISFMLTNTSETSEIQLFSKDCSKTGFNTPDTPETIYPFTWDETNSKYVQATSGDKVARYDQMLKFFGYDPTSSDDQTSFQNAVKPKLVITMHKDADPETITLTSSDVLLGYKTYCNPDAAYAVENVRIYKATQPSAGDETIELKYVESTVIPANTPVVLRNLDETQPNTITLTKTSESAPSGAYDDNAFLVATSTTGAVSNAYVLGYLEGEGNGFGFYPYSVYMTEGQVYVTVPSGAKKLTIKFSDGAATAINNVNANVNVAKAQNGKFIQNGKLVIVKNGKQYNAAGAQVK